MIEGHGEEAEEDGDTASPARSSHAGAASRAVIDRVVAAADDGTGAVGAGPSSTATSRGRVVNPGAG